MYDVVIVGGGPAGLSAALVLGRCRRKVLLCDDGRPRNFAVRRTRGFLTRDGATPQSIRARGRAEIARYGVEVRATRVVDVEREPGPCFLVTTATAKLSARTLLIASGIIDELPPIEGFAALYGTSVFHCPYCDGWEQRDRPLGVYGRGRGTIEMALGLTTWSSDVALFWSDERTIDPRDRERLALHGVAFYTTPIERLEHDGRRLKRVRLVDGTAIARRAMFFHTPTRPQSDLAAKLGCALDERGRVWMDEKERTRVDGVFVAGDAAHDMHSIAVAVAEGYKAGVAINQALREQRTARVSIVGADVLRP